MSTVVAPLATARAQRHDFMWPFATFWLGAVAAFAILALVVVTHRQSRTYVTQPQAARLAGVVLVQAKQLQEQRAALLALANVERINHETILTLMRVQGNLYQALRSIAARERLITR